MAESMADLAESTGASIRVQVCYALPDHAFLRAVALPPGATLEQAVRESGLLRERPEIDMATCTVGVYAKKKTLATVLRDGDRVEVYRPLQADPKDARRRRAGSKPAKT